MAFLKRRFVAVLTFAVLDALLAAPAVAAVTYVVTVDTSTVNGTSGYLDFQFNPGNATSQPATAQITGFTSTGGSFTAAPATTGNVSGTLPGTVTFVNSTAMNEYFHQFTYGSSFTFLIVLSGPAIDAPNGIATAGSTFGIGLYDSAQLPILTNQGLLSGFAGQIDINLDGTTTPNGFPNQNNGPSVVTFTLQALDGYQIRYFSNLTAGDSVINITNTGANGASLNGPGFGPAVGNTCVNVYAFSPDEQLISCCSCLVTPNGLVSLSVVNDLVSNTLTGVRPNSIVVKLLNTATGFVGGAPVFTGDGCNNSAALAGSANLPTASGMLAWGTTIHGSIGGGFAVTETPFLKATLGIAEQASVRNRCSAIIGNGSTFGVCRSCRPGGLGAAAK